MTEAGAGSEQAYVKPSDWTCEALYEMANKKRKALNLLLSSSRQSMHMTVLKGMAAPTKSVLPLWLRAFIMYAIGLKPGGRIDYDHLDSILDQGSSRQSCDISRFREWRQERYARKEEEEGVGEADEASLCGVAESNSDAEGGWSEVGQAPTVKSRGPRWWFGNQSPCEPPHLGGGLPCWRPRRGGCGRRRGSGLGPAEGVQRRRELSRREAVGLRRREPEGWRGRVLGIPVGHQATLPPPFA